MTDERLKELYSNLLNDVDFDKLDLGLKNPNIFSILRISRNEIRHSNFLCWLLDPNQSHGLGDIFLKRFLREVFSSDRFEQVSQVDVEGLNLSDAEILREWNHIDILIVTDEVVVCVENKVMTTDHSNQLERYRKIIESNYPKRKNTFVYLNPMGEDPSEEVDNYYPLSYDFVVDTLSRILEVYKDSMKGQVVQYLKDYIDILKQDIMGTDKLTELSQKIYSNHKELFEFILERKPDLTQEVNDLLVEVVEEFGFIVGSTNKFHVRFLTEKTKPLVYFNKVVKNGWKLGESFAFEIKIQSDGIMFLFVISPSDQEYDSIKLSEMLMSIKDFKEPHGKKWIVPYRKKEKVNFDEFQTMTREERKDQLCNFVKKFIPLIEEVENKLLENKDELLQMKDV